MKLTINPADGTIVAETSDDISAAQFVRELLSGSAAPPPPKAIEAKRVATKKPRKKRKLAPPKADRPLTKVHDETWAWLAASDRPEGVTADEVAKAFGLSHAGGLWRINELIKRDMAWRVGPGRYRVGSVTEAATVLSNGARS